MLCRKVKQINFNKFKTVPNDKVINEIKKDKKLKYLYILIAPRKEYEDLIGDDDILRKVSERIIEIDEELANEK